MSLRNVGSKGGIILRVVSLQKLCTVVATRSWWTRNTRGGEGECRERGGEGAGRVEQKWCRTLNTTILYDHPMQRSPARRWYLPSDTGSRTVSRIEAKQTERRNEKGEDGHEGPGHEEEKREQRSLERGQGRVVEKSKRAK